MQSHIVNQTQEHIKAEGEEDKNHHGPPPDRFMSESENMRTGIVGTDALSKALSRQGIKTEMQLSNLGIDDKRTTTYYRNKQKKEAFEIMMQASHKFNIHQATLDLAKEEYSRYRDVREHVHDFEACVAACLILGLEENLLRGGMDGVADYKARPQYILAKPSLALVEESEVKSTSVAVVTNEGIAMACWTDSQSRDWLQRVLGGYEFEQGTAIPPNSEKIKAALVEVICSKLLSVKLQVAMTKGTQVELKPSVFGSLTAASRNKMFQKADTSSSESCLIGSGLVVANLKSILAEKKDELATLGVNSALRDCLAMHVKNAVASRLQHDSNKRKREHDKSLETKRLRLEKSAADRVGLMNMSIVTAVQEAKGSSYAPIVMATGGQSLADELLSFSGDFEGTSNVQHVVKSESKVSLASKDSDHSISSEPINPEPAVKVVKQVKVKIKFG